MPKSANRDTPRKIDVFPPLLIPQSRTLTAHRNLLAWRIIGHHELIEHLAADFRHHNSPFGPFAILKNYFNFTPLKTHSQL